MKPEELVEQQQTILEILHTLMPPTHMYDTNFLDVSFIKSHKAGELFARRRIVSKICDISLFDYVLIQICKEYGYYNRFITSDNTICNMNTTNLVKKAYQTVQTIDKQRFVFADCSNIEEVPAMIRKYRLTEIIESL